MEETRPRSKKVRALQLVFGQTPAEIAEAWSTAPLSYRETAIVWERRVREVYPELEMRFTYSDVFRVLRRYSR